MPLITLSPAQQAAHDRALALSNEHFLVGLVARSGNGRTEILQRLALSMNGQYLRMADFAEKIQKFKPLCNTSQL